MKLFFGNSAMHAGARFASAFVTDHATKAQNALDSVDRGNDAHHGTPSAGEFCRKNGKLSMRVGDVFVANAGNGLGFFVTTKAQAAEYAIHNHSIGDGSKVAVDNPVVLKVAPVNPSESQMGVKTMGSYWPFFYASTALKIMEMYEVSPDKRLVPIQQIADKSAIAQPQKQQPAASMSSVVSSFVEGLFSSTKK